MPVNVTTASRNVMSCSVQDFVPQLARRQVYSQILYAWGFTSNSPSKPEKQARKQRIVQFSGGS